MLWKRWRLVRTLRKRRFDHIILDNGGWRYARTLGGKEMIGCHEPTQPADRQPDRMPPDHGGFEEREVSKMSKLGSVLGVEQAMGKTWLFPDASVLAQEKTRLHSLGWDPAKPTCVIHIRSRMPQQRWSQESFVALATELLQDDARRPQQLLLFWSPGTESGAMHPGDDEKAFRILARLQGLPIVRCPTENITQLIAAMALPDQVICSDGGAMHVATALDKLILCFFGPSHVAEWYPWGVPHVVIQPPSREVSSISVQEAMQGFAELQKLIRNSGNRTS